MPAHTVKDLHQQAVTSLLTVAAPALELGQRFASAGFELALVGGTVRDALLGRLSHDIDLTTDATPEQVLPLVKQWADAVWEIGREFGTIGLRKNGLTLEITTYRAESYDPASRKPQVIYGTSLLGDLMRRDFTINALAVRLPSLEFVDPGTGMDDLAAQILRTPGTPEQSFTDDPLRMLRAARFAAQLGFRVAPKVVQAMQEMRERLGIVSAERISDELSKLLLAPNPRQGLALLVQTGLAQQVLPELPALRLEIDEHHRHKDVYEHSLTVLEQGMAMEHRLPTAFPDLPEGATDEQRHAARDPQPDLVLRLACLLHDIGKPRTRRYEPDGGVSFHHHDVVGAKMARKRLRALRFPNEVVDAVARLVELHLRFHGYGGGQWSDSAVRRYARDAGPLLEHLHILTRADCTTRNQRKAQALQRTYDALELRIAQLAAQEELEAVRPDLDGNQIMAILGVPAGPQVGQAYKYLLELRLDHGPMSAEQAEQALRTWWANHQS